MGKTSNLYLDCLPSPEPTLPRLTLSPGALSSKDPVSSQNCNQFITLPTTFAVPYSPYQSFAEIPFFPPPAQEMQSAPSSNQVNTIKLCKLVFSISEDDTAVSVLIARYVCLTVPLSYRNRFPLVASYRKEIKSSWSAVCVAMQCIMYLVDVKIIAGLLPPRYRGPKELLRLPVKSCFTHARF